MTLFRRYLCAAVLGIPFIFCQAVMAAEAESPKSENSKVVVLGLIQSLRRNAVSAQQAALALGQMGHEAAPAIPDLVEALRYDENSVSVAVSDALVAIGPDAIPELRDALSDSSFIVRARAAGALARFGSRAKRAAPSLVELLRDPQTMVYTAADQALAQMGEEAVPALSAALKRSKAGDRKIYLSTLSRCGAKAIPIMLDLLKNDDTSFIRGSAAAALGSVRPSTSEIVEALIGALGDLQESVRGEAAVSLGEIGAGAKAALGALLRVSLNDPDALVRKKSLDAIAQIGSPTQESMPELIKGLHDSHAEVRRTVVELIGQSSMTWTEIAPILESAFKDPDASVRLKVIEASGQNRAGTNPLPILRNAVSDPDLEVRSAAAAALGRLPLNAEAAAELGKMLSDKNPVIRQQAIQSLSQMGSLGLPGLLQALSDSYGVLSDEAAGAIAQIGTEAIPALQALENGPDPELKVKAAQLIKKIQRRHRIKKSK